MVCRVTISFLFFSGKDALDVGATMGKRKDLFEAKSELRSRKRSEIERGESIYEGVAAVFDQYLQRANTTLQQLWSEFSVGAADVMQPSDGLSSVGVYIVAKLAKLLEATKLRNTSTHWPWKPWLLPRDAGQSQI